MNVSVVASPPASGKAWYMTNRAPLTGTPLLKLPLGAVRPAGWLRRQLELMVEGMVGRLTELSEYLAEGNGWLGGARDGWEEQPYWFRGFYSLAALAGDERCLAISRRWIEAIFASQQPDGYFGPTSQKAITGRTGQTICDLWPHMIMLDAVIRHHEFTGDARVGGFLTRFFDFCRRLPEDQLVPPYLWKGGGPVNYFEEFNNDWRPTIQHKRAGDMIPHVLYAYNLTGEDWLPDLATRFFRCIQPPYSEWLEHHVVHFTQRYGYDGTYYQVSGDPLHLARSEYWYAEHMAVWGQQPRGIFAADEQVRSNKQDPRQAFETCGMTEFAKNFYILGRVTGNPIYADRAEDILLNHFPAAQTADLKALHYLTASNQPQLDASDRHDYMNQARMIDYSPHRYRCCQHNVAMGWPWYAENLFQATADGGLAAWMYSACDVKAKAGPKGGELSLAVRTDYPFKDRVRLTVNSPARGSTPLYLRVPGWCDGFSATLNGRPLATAAPAGTYLRVQRAWAAGDTLDIRLPMKLSLTQWPRSGSLTIDRGPLSYSVRIEERWRRCGGTDAWPEWEVLPASAWNYGLPIDRGDPLAGAKVVEKKKVAAQPWTLEAAPVEIRLKARRVPGWTIGADQTVQELRPAPARVAGRSETIRMIPLGCARLRIACLPRVGETPDAIEW